ncbi:Atrial natriuretic peptide receptor 1 [Lamellibrachia satsuma]|nr:Atrial natriuretic peptide receptor 1 [Lamellibrachia satsuma]
MIGLACVLAVGAFGGRRVWGHMKFDIDLQLTHLRKIDWCDLEIQDRSTTSINSDDGKKQALAMYKSTPVAVKMIPGRRSIDSEDIAIQMELKYMRDMKHRNINRFVGTCGMAPHMCVLMSYCKRGSLQDVLNAKFFNLSFHWRLSFALDIAEGMVYLHSSPIISHGHLSSTNVVVDRQWVCKVTDYGLPLFRSGDSHSVNKSDFEEEIDVKCLYMAPEILERTETSAIGTKGGDVYSFGIIMNDLTLMAGPYSIEMTDLTTEEIVYRIIDKEEVPFRPSIGECQCAEYWLNLMQTCWDEFPQNRPTFSKIKQVLHDNSDDRYTNEAEDEKALCMLEEHSAYLETVRNEKIKEKAELQREHDRLSLLTDKVFNHLPRHVADAMKEGKAIESDCFDSVSIYVSDIVDFHPLIAVSTPKEIADMLNKLWGTFEQIAKKFDIYQIDAMGDAYVLASGPSHNNALWQAQQIAAYALSVMRKLKDYRIPHKPDKPLRLRIGIHAGPCVGGVVGNKIPRYCLFGDTMTIATQMELHGEPSKIHTSQTMKRLLDAVGDFHLDYNSELQIKGLAKMNTYWLKRYSPSDATTISSSTSVSSKTLSLQYREKLEPVSAQRVSLSIPQGGDAI